MLSWIWSARVCTGSTFLSSAGLIEILSERQIRHYDIHTKQMAESQHWLPDELPTRLIITSGASCPDILMNQVLQKVAGFYGYGEVEIAEAKLSLFKEL